MKFIGNDNQDAQDIFVSDSELKSHVFMIGRTVRGRSSVIEAEANRRGISYDGAEKASSPAEEERQAAELREDAARAKRDQRLAAVRDAYWAATDPNSSEFDGLHDVLNVVCGSNPTDEQVHKLYNMLPAEVIGEGVKWGFTDTVVRDAIHEFVSENKADVIATVFAF